MCTYRIDTHVRCEVLRCLAYIRANRKIIACRPNLIQMMLRIWHPMRTLPRLTWTFAGYWAFFIYVRFSMRGFEWLRSTEVSERGRRSEFEVLPRTQTLDPSERATPFVQFLSVSREIKSATRVKDRFLTIHSLSLSPEHSDNQKSTGFP
jgi:hypothetical protein